MTKKKRYHQAYRMTGKEAPVLEQLLAAKQNLHTRLDALTLQAREVDMAYNRCIAELASLESQIAYVREKKEDGA